MSRLNHTLGAIADETRRAMLERLRSGERSISELAEPHAMTLSGALKHIRILEDAGLLRSEKRGRVVWCRLSPEPLKRVADWVSRYEAFWDEQLESLDAHLSKPASEEPR